MAGFLSTLRNSCNNVFNSVKHTLSRLKNWFNHEAIPILQGIASTIHHIYRNYVQPFVRHIIRFIGNHRFEIVILILIITTIIYPDIITLPLLFTLGFALTGPTAFSLASLIQAMIGNVTAGSLFAILQSAGMLGYGLGIFSACVIACAVLLVFSVVHMITKTD